MSQVLLLEVNMGIISDLYTQLFGKDHIRDGDVISFSEHGRVGGLSTGQGFKFVSTIDGTLPTTGNNPSTVLGYTDGLLTTITETIDSEQYQTTLSYTDGVLTGISEVVKL